MSTSAQKPRYEFGGPYVIELPDHAHPLRTLRAY